MQLLTKCLCSRPFIKQKFIKYCKYRKFQRGSRSGHGNTERSNVRWRCYEKWRVDITQVKGGSDGAEGTACAGPERHRKGKEEIFCGWNTEHKDDQSQGSSQGWAWDPAKIQAFLLNAKGSPWRFQAKQWPDRVCLCFLSCIAGRLDLMWEKQVGNKCTGTSKTLAAKRQKEM